MDRSRPLLLLLALALTGVIAVAVVSQLYARELGTRLFLLLF